MNFIYIRSAFWTLYLVFLLTVVLLVSSCATGQNTDISSGLMDGEKIDLTTGKDKFLFTQWKGSAIPVWTYIPDRKDIRDLPIVIVMHGTGRDADRYRDEWAAHAEENGLIIIAPEFSKKNFPKAENYNLGGVFKGKDNVYQAEDSWGFSAIEPLFSRVVDLLDSRQKEYTLYGHSAGSQFVHRFLFYKPDARVKRYIAANAGWYTMPDFTEIFPYGLKDAKVSAENVKAALQKDVVILLGDQDIDQSGSSLRRTAEAMRQGVHRFERGHSFFNQAQKKAREFNVPFGWRLGIVRGAGHSNAQMAVVAAKLVY